MRRPPPAAVLAALVAVSALVRWAGAREVPAPWFTPDEQTYALLGRSLWDSGRLAILGVHEPAFYSFVYPALAGLPLSRHDIAGGYAALKVVQAIVMSLTAVPVYLWGRTLAGRGWALTAAALSLAIPALAFSGFVMTEVAFYPVVVLAAWTLARALAVPTPRRQALALALIVVAVTTRLQALVLAPVVVLAVALQLAFERRGAGRTTGLCFSGQSRLPLHEAVSAPGAGGRNAETPLRKRLVHWNTKSVRDHAPLLGGLAGLAVLWLLVQRGHALGAYGVTGRVSYSPGAAVRFFLYHAADLLLMTVFLPVVAFAIVAARSFARAEESRDVQAFVAVTVATTLGFLGQVALFTSRLLGRLAERNLIGVAPLLFLGFAIWLDRGCPRPRVVTALAGAGAIGLLAYFPASSLVTEAAEPDAFTLIPLYKLRTADASLDLRLLLVVGGAGLLAVLWLWPRSLRAGLPVLLAAVLAAASVSATREVASKARGFGLTMAGRDPTWIDRTAGGPVAYLYAGELGWSGGAPPWENAFWNRRIDRVYVLGRARIAGPLPRTRVARRPDGTLVTRAGRPIEVDWVVAPKRFSFDGQAILGSDDSGLDLWHVRRPLRLRG